MGLNIHNLTILRDQIQHIPPSRFDMAAWSTVKADDATATLDQMRHNCGTAACIGGWAETLFVASQPEDRIGEADDELVHEALGITLEQANDLFFPYQQLRDADMETDYNSLTQRQAVEVLDHLIATDSVDWPRAIRMHP